MTRVLKLSLVVVALIATLSSCKKDKTKEMQTEVKENYAKMALANYQDALSTAKEMQTAINAFVANPTTATHKAAKDAWLAAREPYGQSEAFRFAGGPIDEYDKAPEGLLNAWPCDENYVDYVAGTPTSGIINNTAIAIDGATLESKHEVGGETNVSVGYHAVEFLLWGQDLDAPALETAGKRPHTDYLAGGPGEVERRKEYLKVSTQLIIDHLTWLTEQWKDGGAYRKAFMAEDDTKTIKKLIQSIAIFSKGELAGERIIVAYTNQDQEDEHSCFSDNTNRDIITNQMGIANIFLGKYGSVSGTSLYDLVKVKNETLADATKKALETSGTQAKGIYQRFDVAITNPTYRPAVLELGNSLKDVGNKLVECGEALGYENLTADLPE